MAAPLTPLRPDSFWDGKQGGGVRCSAIGQAANTYQDPSDAFFEGNGGRSVAQCLPMGPGVRGVIVPRATMWGGSRGFNPHAPRLMNVDPDIKGQASVVDYAQLDKDTIRAAYAAAWEQVGDYGDPRLVASQAFRNLAVDTEPVGLGNDPRGSPLEANRGLQPIPGFNAYVAPRATSGGGQQLYNQPQRALAPEAIMSPSVSTGAPPRPTDDTTGVLPQGMPLPEDMSKATPAQLKQAAMRASVRPGQSYDPWGNQPQGPPLAPARQILQQPAQPQGQPLQQQGQPLQQQQQGFGQPAAQSSAPFQYPPAYQPGVPPPGFQQPPQPLAAPVFPGTVAPAQVPAMFPQQAPQNPFAKLGQAASQPQQPAGPPSKGVVFEIAGWGRQEAWFHDIIRNEHLFVFVWDKRCASGKVFPPKMEPSEDGSARVAVFVRDTPDRIYYIHSTGATFPHVTYEYCVCVVDKEVPVQG